MEWRVRWRCSTTRTRLRAGGITGSHPTGDFSRVVEVGITRYVFVILANLRVITSLHTIHIYTRSSLELPFQKKKRKKKILFLFMVSDYE